MCKDAWGIFHVEVFWATKGHYDWEEVIGEHWKRLVPLSFPENGLSIKKACCIIRHFGKFKNKPFPTIPNDVRNQRIKAIV